MAPKKAMMQMKSWPLIEKNITKNDKIVIKIT